MHKNLLILYLPSPLQGVNISIICKLAYLFHLLSKICLLSNEKKCSVAILFDFPI